MAEYTEIHFRMGGPTGAEFQRYWDGEVVGAKGTPEARARFRDEQKPAAGMGLALPAEVTLVAEHVLQFLQSGFAQEVLKMAGTAIGAGVAKFIWEKLRDFFKKPQPVPVPESVMIVVNRVEIVFNPHTMDANPSKAFEDALRQLN